MALFVEGVGEKSNLVLPLFEGELFGDFGDLASIGDLMEVFCSGDFASSSLMLLNYVE